jgi:hypothetical protein
MATMKNIPDIFLMVPGVGGCYHGGGLCAYFLGLGPGYLGATEL